MKNILIVSDSHGIKDKLIELFKLYKDYIIIHLGDYCINRNILDEYNVLYVSGNCDFPYLNERIEIINNNKFFITHGNKYNVKNTINNIYYRSKELEVSYTLFGHTHIETFFKEDEIIFINPGSFKDTGSYVLIIDGKVYFKRM